MNSPSAKSEPAASQKSTRNTIRGAALKWSDWSCKKRKTARIGKTTKPRKTEKTFLKKKKKKTHTDSVQTWPKAVFEVRPKNETRNSKKEVIINNVKQRTRESKRTKTNDTSKKRRLKTQKGIETKQQARFAVDYDLIYHQSSQFRGSPILWVFKIFLIFSGSSSRLFCVVSSIDSCPNH